MTFLQNDSPLPLLQLPRVGGGLLKLPDDLAGHSASAAQLSATLGCYLSDDGSLAQSTGFVITPTGTLLTAVYSSGAIGRLRTTTCSDWSPTPRAPP